MSDGLREKQRQQRRDTILTAAHRLLTEQGYEEVTMDEIAAAAGVTKPTLYAYFPTKEEVVVQAVVRLACQGCLRIASLDPTQPASARLSEVFRWALHRKFVEGNASLTGVATPLLRNHPDYQAAFQDMLARLSTMVRQGQAAGEFDPDLNPELAVRPFFSILRDIEYFHLIQSGAVTPEVLVHHLSTQLLNGLLRRS